MSLKETDSPRSILAHKNSTFSLVSVESMLMERLNGGARVTVHNELPLDRLVWRRSVELD